MKKFIIILVIIVLISLAVYFIAKWNKNRKEKLAKEESKPAETPIVNPLEQLASARPVLTGFQTVETTATRIN